MIENCVLNLMDPQIAMHSRLYFSCFFNYNGLGAGLVHI